MKKKVLSLLLAVCLVVGMSPVAASAAGSAFSDVPNTHWAYHHVQQAAEKGWITGIGGGCYAPEQRVTGAEFVTMIMKSLYFEEVAPGSAGEPWYQPYVDVAQAHGLLTSDLGEKAVLNNPLNRYRMATFLYNVVKEVGAVHYVDGGILSSDGVTVLSSSNASNYIGDWAKIPGEYQEPVMGVYALKLLSGMDEYGTFGGESYLTRAQAAVVLNTTNSCCSNSSGSEPEEKPTDPSEHVHNFVDVGVKPMDWTYSPEPGYTGPTNTLEAVNAINACLRCGQYFGGEDVFVDRYFGHVHGPDSVCKGTYSLRTVYACYHLLECSTPGCNAYRRGALDHYEYLIYFKGNGDEPTAFTLEDWQIEELGLPMP